MPSATVEDYVKRLYLQQQDKPRRRLVPVGELATAMNVVPGSATTMVKTLAESGLVEYAPRFGVRLTRNGEQLALHVLRRHRLIELFLVKVLKLDWSQVHLEAETLEHAVSDKVLEAIDKALGSPEVDPHGDPIPSAKGRVADVSDALDLTKAPVKRKLHVTRVLDQTPAFLQFVERCGLRPGAQVRVEERDEQASSIIVTTDGGQRDEENAVTLGWSAAQKIVAE